MWLKKEGFEDFIKGWWQGVSVCETANFILSRKMKEVKLLLKAWNRDCFGRLEVNKKVALSQIQAWDHLEEKRDLTLEESEAKKGAKDAFRN